MENTKSFKRKMLLWTNSWFQEEPESTKEFVPAAMDIAYLLQATGFHVRTMEKCLRKTNSTEKLSANDSACHVILACPKTGFAIELDAPTSACKCELYNSDSILRRLGDAEMSKSVSQLLGGLFDVMSKLDDHNQSNKEKLIKESMISDKTAIQLEKSSTTANNCSSLSATMTTPATGIVIVTPNAPCILKTSPEDEKSLVPGRYRSLDTLITSGSSFPDELPEPGQLTPKENLESRPEMDMEVDGDQNAGPSSGNKKFISKSSPAVNRTEQFKRSDTFVFENMEENESTKTDGNRILVRSNTYVSNLPLPNDEDKQPSGVSPSQITPNSLISPTFSKKMILGKLQELQNTINDLVFMVSGEEKNPLKLAGDAAKPKTNGARPIRSLSDFGGISNLNRVQGTSARSIPRPNVPTARRRTTMGGGIATPTTSRPTGTTVSVYRRKSASTTALLMSGETAVSRNGATPKLGGSNRLITPQSSQRKDLTSPKSTAINTSGSKNKETALSASTFTGTRQLLTPNRKYAHVQSGIPKSTVSRK